MFCEKGALKNFAKFTGKLSRNLVILLYDCLPINKIYRPKKRILFWSVWQDHGRFEVRFEDLKIFSFLFFFLVLRLCFIFIFEKDKNKVLKFDDVFPLPWNMNIWEMSHNGCRTMLLFAIFCKISTLERNVYWFHVKWIFTIFGQSFKLDVRA